MAGRPHVRAGELRTGELAAVPHDVEQLRAVEPAGQERRPVVLGATHPHPGEDALLEHEIGRAHV